MGLFKKKVVKEESELDKRVKRIRELESRLKSDIGLFEDVSSRIGFTLKELYFLKFYRSYDNCIYYKDKQVDIDKIYEELLRGILLTHDNVMVDNPLILVDFDKENWRPYETLKDKSDFIEEDIRRYSGNYQLCDCGRFVSKWCPICICGKEFKVDEIYFTDVIHDDTVYDDATDSFDYVYAERQIQTGKNEYRYEIEQNDGSIIEGRLGVVPLKADTKD